MKRFMILITCICVLAGFPAVSAWAIWEGNAGIAAASEFPGKGMFARSDMFPKNTIVVIENLETGISVRAVITGSSNVSGLVAVLSPDTASALNIKPGSVSRVRVSIPSAVSEPGNRAASESDTAVNSNDPDVNPAVAAAAAPIPLEAIAASSDNPLVPLDESKDVSTEAETEEPSVSAVATDVPESGIESADAEAVASDSAAEVPMENGGAVALSDNSVFYDEPAIVAIDEGSAVVESAEQPEVAEVTPPAESASVTLVPSEPNPPAVPEDISPAVTAAIPVPEVEPVSAVVPVTVVTVPIPVPAEGALIGKGSFYVQIATYTDPSNAKAVMDKYGKKYPVIVEKASGTSGDVLKVCIGPVKKDEYGAVLERFKSLGFRDAFVRKGM
jgi:hypothetical protein